jgi:protease IV
MMISPEYIIERKRNKSLLSRWKSFALILFVALIIVGGDFLPQNPLLGQSNPVGGHEYIASIEIDEIIFDDQERSRKLHDLAEDKKVKAVIVHINSPGGSVVGSEMLYNAFTRIAEKKPIVSVLGSVAASGGYMAAIGTDQIFAHNGTITGSIGVIMQSAEVTELAEKLGVRFHNFKSSELKAAPNPTEKLTPEVNQAIMENIYDTYDFFVELVAKRRKLKLEQAKQIADGRVYSGRQALQHGLIDAIGDEEMAVKWLQEKRQISKDLKVKEYKLKPAGGLLETILQDMEGRVSSFINSRNFSGLKAF